MVNNSIQDVNSNLLQYKDVAVTYNPSYTSPANTYAGLYNYASDADLKGKHIVAITTISLSASNNIIPSYQINESAGILYFVTYETVEIFNITVRILYAK